MATSDTCPDCVTVDYGLKEFLQGRNAGNELQMREGAEKVWLGVVESVNRFLRRLPQALWTSETGEDELKGPGGHRRRTQLLSGQPNKGVSRREDILSRYRLARGVLHGDAYYEGILTEDTEPVMRDMRRLAEWLDSGGSTTVVPTWERPG